MRDGNAPVLRALGHHPLGPEMHREMGPVVVALAESFPGRLAFVLPNSVVRHKAPEEREIDDDAVIKIRIPERGNTLNLIEEHAELGDEGLLLVQLLPMLGTRGVRCLARQ